MPEREDYSRIKNLKQLTGSVNFVSLNNLNVLYLLEFKNPLVRAAIHETKFHDTLKAQSLLGGVMDNFLTSSSKQYDVIIPMPLARVRQKKRGFNQIERILKQANIKYDPSVLRREDRPPQTTLSREERLKNVAGAFSVATEKAPVIAGAHILLIDDVVTTGATLQAAQATLAPLSPASITCLALAH